MTGIYKFQGFSTKNAETMQGIVSLGVLAAKILVEDISNEYRRKR